MFDQRVAARLEAVSSPIISWRLPKICDFLICFKMNPAKKLF
jgi:hypothetical protein